MTERSPMDVYLDAANVARLEEDHALAAALMRAALRSAAGIPASRDPLNDPNFRHAASNEDGS